MMHSIVSIPITILIVIAVYRTTSERPKDEVTVWPPTYFSTVAERVRLVPNRRAPFSRIAEAVLGSCKGGNCRLCSGEQLTTFVRHKTSGNQPGSAFHVRLLVIEKHMGAEGL